MTHQWWVPVRTMTLTLDGIKDSGPMTKTKPGAVQRPGIPLDKVQFRSTQMFGPRRRAIALDNTKPGWSETAKMRWHPFALEVRFDDGETYLVGHSCIETARVAMPPEDSSAG